MKNILLIITLLISWNAIAEEKVWYCTPDSHIGLTFSKDTMKFEMTEFSNVNRIAIKQYDDYLIIPEDSFGADNFSYDECSLAFRGRVVSCSDKTNTFNLNIKTGYAISSRAFGWILSRKDKP